MVQGNLHFTPGYSLLKCKVHYELHGVAGLVKGRGLFADILQSSELKENQMLANTFANQHLRCRYINHINTRQVSFYLETCYIWEVGGLHNSSCYAEQT